MHEWLEDWAEEDGVILPEWPPYSPDLNPIENLWAIVKERIHERYPDLGQMPKNMAALERLVDAAIEVWGDIEKEVF